jgi:hypothetical protein
VSIVKYSTAFVGIYFLKIDFVPVMVSQHIRRSDFYVGVVGSGSE